jgi:hypothetical protein
MRAKLLRDAPELRHDPMLDSTPEHSATEKKRVELNGVIVSFDDH